jgi:hypothetical protein
MHSQDESGAPPAEPADGRHGRLWTPEAAMEPLPPLAPPPARPGAGTPVATVPRPLERGAPLSMLLTAAGVVLVIAGLVVLVLALGR